MTQHQGFVYASKDYILVYIGNAQPPPGAKPFKAQIRYKSRPLRMDEIEIAIMEKLGPGAVAAQKTRIKPGNYVIYPFLRVPKKTIIIIDDEQTSRLDGVTIAGLAAQLALYGEAYVAMSSRRLSLGHMMAELVELGENKFIPYKRTGPAIYYKHVDGSNVFVYHYGADRPRPCMPQDLVDVLESLGHGYLVELATWLPYTDIVVEKGPRLPADTAKGLAFIAIPPHTMTRIIAVPSPLRITIESIGLVLPEIKPA